MGASDCFLHLKGTRAEVVAEFSRAVQEARFEDGNGPYSGTIATMGSMAVVDLAANPRIPDPAALRAALATKEFPLRVAAVQDWILEHHEKWNPALAVEVAPGQWVVGGWAAS